MGSTSKKIPRLEEESAVAPGRPDDEGTKEAALFAKGMSRDEIKRNAATAEARRNERFRDNFECIAIIALWLTSFVLAILGIAWLWHVLLPESCHWLRPDQIAKLQNMVTGGVITGIATGHIKRRLS